MQGTGHELLAGTVGAGNEDAGVGWRHLGNDVADVADGLALANHLLAIDFFLEDFVLFHQVHPFGGVLDGDQDAVQVQGLLDEVEGTLFHAIHGGVDVAVTGNHDDGGFNSFLFQF